MMNNSDFLEKCPKRCVVERCGDGYVPVIYYKWAGTKVRYSSGGYTQDLEAAKKELLDLKLKEEEYRKRHQNDGEVVYEL